MSRGLGRTQRAILELIEGNPDGAWRTREVYWQVYKSFPNKAQRVAVLRAIRSLPGTWTVEYFNARGYWLCDPCNLASVHKAHGYVDPVHLKPGGYIYDGVQRAKRYRDGSPIERIDMDIESERRRLAFQKELGPVTPEVAKYFAERIRQLQEEKAKLIEQQASQQGAQQMADKSRSQLISEDILAECQLEGCTPQLSFMAITRTDGQFLAEIESHSPNAFDRYLTLLRTNLQAARTWKP